MGSLSTAEAAPVSLPVARTVVVLVGAWFFLSWWVAAYHHQVHPDFDVHYLGGRVEREGGSYTDTRRLLAEAGPAHAAPTQGPIYGGPSLIALVFEPLSALPRQVAWHLFVVVCGAAMVKDEARIAIRDVPDEPGISHRIFSLLAEYAIVVDMIAQNVATNGSAAHRVSQPAGR